MKTVFFLISLLLTENIVLSQYSERISRSQYFDIYKDIAVKEMHRSGVPASITLAQGALESADGNSRLARNGNNHFGIKCHNDWNGKKIFEDDDAKNECFRKYGSVEDSYKDHSDYLRAKTRYAFLFELNSTDYKGWARGLKKAGYATSPSYAESLIRIIEEYNLNMYDRLEAGSAKSHERRKHSSSSVTKSARQIMERNRVKYVLAMQGDSYESITDDLGKLNWELAEYNDLKQIDSLAPGQVLYIQPKRNKAETGKNVHVVREGETMYTISQQYAIRLSALYAMNQLTPGSKLNPGTVLQLRKPVKRSVQKSIMEEDKRDSGEQEEIKVDLNLE
jgi:LysM repeat protein